MRRCRCGTRKVYPRACGGTSLRRQLLEDPQGLSPRVRGEPLLGHGWPRDLAVYPRACGGTAQVKAAYLGMRGLSPRVRGNLQRMREML